jgi:hypothetical protein
MKNYYLIALVCCILNSCTKDDSNYSDSAFVSKKEIEVFNFESKDAMYKKVDEILLLEEKQQQKILYDFKDRNNEKILSNKSIDKTDENSKNIAVLKDLKEYNVDKLKAIYELRKELNFKSIQSIANEINSLMIVDSLKAKELYSKYQRFLKLDEFLVKTIYNDRIANILNSSGEVLINNAKIKVEEKNSFNHITGKYIRDEAVVTGIVANSGDFYVNYQAGREVHENDLGVKYFKYYCRLVALYKIHKRISPGVSYYYIPCPTTYTVNSGSLAGFVQSGDNPFGAYAFAYDYLSGYGESVINIGGNKNVAYVPAGGNVSGTFSTTTGGFYQEMTGSVTYQEN